MATPEPLEQVPTQPGKEVDDLASLPGRGEMAGLGRDDVAPEPEPEEPENEPGEEPKAPAYSPEQIAAMEEKAASYDWITKQPDLMQVMSDYLKKKAEPQEKPARGSDRVDQLENTLKQMHRELELTQFMVRNPVLVNDQEALQHWAGLIRDGLSEQKAFDLTKREIELRQAKQPKAPKLQGSERGHVGGGERRSSGKWDKQIAAARNAGDAVDAAWRAVMEERGLTD